MIYCENLTYMYRKSHEGISSFSIDVTSNDTGRIFGLLGANGSGKSTLMRLLTGILMPQSGVVKVHGFESKKRNPYMLQEIAMIPEEYDIPPITPKIYEKCWSGFYPNFDKKLFATLQKMLSCPQDQPLHNLSMGQKKRFLFAFTIATQAKLLIFDEPTNHLDIAGKTLFTEIIQKHTNKAQRILISTHQIKDVKNIIDSIIILKKGSCLLHTGIDTINNIFTIEKANKAKQESICEIPYLNESMVLARRKNSKKPTSPIDLELFFLAAVENSPSICDILQSHHNKKKVSNA